MTPWMTRKRRTGKRSPLRRKPLRNPGESVQFEIFFIVCDALAAILVVCFASMVLLVLSDSLLA